MKEVESHANNVQHAAHRRRVAQATAAHPRALLRKSFRRRNRERKTTVSGGSSPSWEFTEKVARMKWAKDAKAAQVAKSSLGKAAAHLMKVNLPLKGASPRESFSGAEAGAHATSGCFA